MATDKRTILMVDDEEGIRSFVREFLKAEGFHVLEAENGKEGLAVVNREHVDLVITDIMMPVMDGLEFFQQLRAIPKFNNLPVIMLTVKDDVNTMKASYLNGAEEYITKPFDPSLLSERVRQILDELSGLNES